MENRKYFKHRITELEAIYANAEGDCAVLEELEEELAHRSTHRAKKLLQNVQNSLNANQPPNISNVEVRSSDRPKAISMPSASPANERSAESNNFNKAIDWEELISTSSDVFPNFGVNS